MGSKQSSEALVLRVRAYRNTSAIVTVYTRDWGKQILMARGIRRYAHKSSRIDQCYLGFVEYIPRRDTEVHLLTHFEVYDEFYGIRQSLQQIYLSQHILEVVDLLSPLDNADEKMFELVVRVFEVLESQVSNVILPWFLVSVLECLGLHSTEHIREHWMQSVLEYMIGTPLSRVDSFKLSRDQIRGILAYVQQVLLQSLHIDIDFNRPRITRPVEYLHAS